MKKILCLLLFTTRLLPAFGQIHADIKPYHDRFIAEAAARNITFEIPAPVAMKFFSKGHKDIHAGCFFTEKTIYVNAEWWAAADETARERTIFHELAHWYFDAGHVRHVSDDIMNPNARFTEYAATRAAHLDILFRNARLIESPIDRSALTLRAGDIIITSDTPESEQCKIFVLADDTPAAAARSLAIVDSVRRTHKQYDYINAKGWRAKPFKYHGSEPDREYGAPVAEVWGEMNRIYMFAADKNRAPRLGMNARAIWRENTEMQLIVDYKTDTFPVRRNATIIYYIKGEPSVAEAKKLINVQ